MDLSREHGDPATIEHLWTFLQDLAFTGFADARLVDRFQPQQNLQMVFKPPLLPDYLSKLLALFTSKPLTKQTRPLIPFVNLFSKRINLLRHSLCSLPQSIRSTLQVKQEV